MNHTDNKIKFPKNFLWGSATSAHQVEGGNYNLPRRSINMVILKIGQI